MMSKGTQCEQEMCSNAYKLFLKLKLAIYIAMYFSALVMKLISSKKLS